jgi:hypothetical protein
VKVGAGIRVLGLATADHRLEGRRRRATELAGSGSLSAWRSARHPTSAAAAPSPPPSQRG